MKRQKEMFIQAAGSPTTLRAVPAADKSAAWIIQLPR
jgi:hypothetical protein